MAISCMIESRADGNATLKLADGQLVTVPEALLPAGAFAGQQLWLAITQTEPLEAAPAAILNEILNPHDEKPA